MSLFWIILVAIYALSPVDLFPEALLGGWGWLEDLVILFFLWRYLRGGGHPLGMFRSGPRQYTGYGPGKTGQSSARNNGHTSHPESEKKPKKNEKNNMKKTKKTATHP